METMTSHITSKASKGLKSSKHLLMSYSSSAYL
jgi:hypothetical protein